MSKEEIQSTLHWVYRGGITIILIIIGTILHDTYAAFGQARDSMIRMEVQFNDFKENTEKRMADMEYRLSAMENDLRKLR
ncbi:MAG TPA: hypothetical protein VK508_01715 [Cyclobacteriaceae bacterium]|nr:hypothetical protein [Cyclobacteriaceae bacterium]